MHPALLKDMRSGQTVAAELVETIDETHLKMVETMWMPVLFQRVKQLVDQGQSTSDWPQSWHWNWRRKMDRIQGLLAFRTFALICEGDLQGLMQVNTAGVCRLSEQADKHLTYVDYVETAPWNRTEIVPNARFKGVGLTMMRAAIEVSHEEGFHGRIGLHSLPRAEPFYARCGLSDLGIDGTCENLRYFEMTAAQAAAFSR
ncbi:GNAT family N-acetyltransferase [Novosphingobium aerophilum]|uniref:GNAT family N-acetyltransferase n=1 Tax=Novosphingobium aerophilum TaxID=2839843 RepID=UPI001BE40A82|nr:GNAT family N-acetyltransferase [Novosphingobium aerophilum]